MTTYSTQNPVGSSDPRDLYDNAENLDSLVNGDQAAYNDRLGKSRKSWQGMEDEFGKAQADRADAFQASQDDREGVFNSYLVSAGYQFAGDYAAGIEITQYNQVVRDTSGELWRASGSTALPYTTTGAGMPEGGAFVAVGDAALRQELGGALSSGLGASLVNGATIYVDSVAEGISGLSLTDGAEISVIGWHVGTEFGGGKFVYRAGVAKSQHNGGTIISPTVPKVSAQAGTSLHDRTLAYLNGIGEVDPGGTGVFVIQNEILFPDHFGAVQSDDTFDCHAIINHGLSVALTLFLPPARAYYVADTVRVGPRWRQLAGMGDAVRGNPARLVWSGGNENRKAVVLVGQNDVGEEPSADGSGLIVKGFSVECNGPNGRAGFGFYGTYITNDSFLERLHASGASQHNMYFAKSWYATYRDLVGLGAVGCGVSFGMPLRYSDGTVENWTTPAPLEMNMTEIRNIRAHSNGMEFVDNPGSFSLSDGHKLRWGYGVGYGVGNGFKADGCTSEGNGGFGVYVYTGAQPSKAIRGGYVENNCRNSGLAAASDLGQILFENTSTVGGAITFEDFLCNYNSGGIWHTGERRNIYLTNLHQPRFLKSLTEPDTAFFAKKNVYYMAGTTNTRTDLGYPLRTERVNTRYSWSFDNIATPVEGQFALYAKGEGSALQGSIKITKVDGTTQSLPWPSNVETGGWHRITTMFSEDVTAVGRGGGASGVDAYATLSLVFFPYVYA